MKSTYILAIMSPDGRSVRQISVGRWCLKLLYISLFTVIVSALGGVSFGLFSKVSHEAVAKSNVDLKQEVQSLQAVLKSKKIEMEEIKRMADRVSSGLGISAKTQGLGQGGFGFNANQPEVSEQDNSGADTRADIPLQVNTSEEKESLGVLVAETRAAIEPVYDYVKKEVKKIDETPSILPILAPDDGEGHFYWFSSRYGWRPHPITKRLELHNGLDIATSKNTPIIAAAHGVVSHIGSDKLLGNMIRIKHPSKKMETIYGHMSKFAKGIDAGEKVVRGEVIGYVGTSGRSTGYHLHYGVWITDKDYKVWVSKEGNWVNPAEAIFDHWPSQ